MKILGSFETSAKIIQGQSITPQKTWILNNTDVTVCIAVLQTLVAEVSIRKVLRPDTSAQFLLRFPVSISEC